MKYLLRPLLALSLLLFAPLVLAWSALGHRLVGELAQRHLMPAARAQVAALLAGEPDPTLGGIATWADTMRQDDPDRFKATQSWHYVKINAADCAYVAARDCPDGNCVVGQIERQRAILADRGRSLPERRDALKFLVHFIGDVHQPLHASNRDDKGGNGYQISLRTDLAPESYAKKDYANGVMGTNLHSIWDYYILGTANLDTANPGTGSLGTTGLGTASPRAASSGTAGFSAGKPAVIPYADRLDTLPWPPAATAPSPAGAWASESCRLVDARKLYPSAHKLDQTYLDAERSLAEQRIRQAAWRLAAMLNEALAD